MLLGDNYLTYEGVDLVWVKYFLQQFKARAE